MRLTARSPPLIFGSHPRRNWPVRLNCWNVWRGLASTSTWLPRSRHHHRGARRQHDVAVPMRPYRLSRSMLYASRQQSPRSRSEQSAHAAGYRIETPWTAPNSRIGPNFEQRRAKRSPVPQRPALLGEGTTDRKGSKRVVSHGRMARAVYR